MPDAFVGAFSDCDESDAVGSERLLLELQYPSDGRVLCTSLGRAQLAKWYAIQQADREVVCTYLDIYRAERARNEVKVTNLRIECASDFPDEAFDLVALPISASGEGELVRDQLQQGYERLVMGGVMLTGSDNASDRWLQDQLSKLFDGITRRVMPGGVVYIARKTKPLARKREYACVFGFLDRERMISVYSRPGVFSHRRLDDGARQLIKSMDLNDDDRVLDIGCGSGAVALAAASRCSKGRVYAVDSNVRAVECTLRGAEANGFHQIGTELNATGSYLESEFTVAFANPPYFSSYRIAKIFLEAARRALVLKGRIVIVTKTVGWYQKVMPDFFGSVSLTPSGAYTIIRGEKQ